jgi:streptomycin 6-kinase
VALVARVDRKELRDAVPHRVDDQAENREAGGCLLAGGGRVAELAARWSLRVGSRFPLTPGSALSNFIAPASLPDGTPVVLKVWADPLDAPPQIAALGIWAGVGAARLLEADIELGAMLLERVQPGGMLSEIDNDDETVRITAALLRQLWQPVPVKHRLRPLSDWCSAYDRNRVALSRGIPGFPAELFMRADALRGDLLESIDMPVVLHGDMHHFNVLRSCRAGWLAIDPHGLAGDRCFDLCQFLRNPVRVPASVNRRRLDLFCAELELDRQRVGDWCLVHAVLDACWDYEEGRPWHASVAYAEQALTF